MPATKINPKQIDKLVAGYVRVSSFSFPAAATAVVTSAVTTALSTAGIGGVAVLVQPSTNERVSGVVTSGSSNRVEVFINSNKARISYFSEEVYGRLTYSLGTYTLSLYSIQGGVETAYTSPSPITIDFEFTYRFELHQLPTDFAVQTRTRIINDDPTGASGAGRIVKEILTVSAPNVVSNLTYTPNVTTNVTLFVNGLEETAVGGSPSFTVTGKVISWNSTNAKYSLETTDRVIASYTTLE